MTYPPTSAVWHAARSEGTPNRSFNALRLFVFTVLTSNPAFTRCLAHPVQQLQFGSLCTVMTGFGDARLLRMVRTPMPATRAKADRRLNDRLFGIVESPSVTHESNHAVGLIAKLPGEYKAKRIEHKKLSAVTPAGARGRLSRIGNKPRRARRRVRGCRGHKGVSCRFSLIVSQNSTEAVDPLLCESDPTSQSNWTHYRLLAGNRIRSAPAPLPLIAME